MRISPLTQGLNTIGGYDAILIGLTPEQEAFHRSCGCCNFYGFVFEGWSNQSWTHKVG